MRTAADVLERIKESLGVASDTELSRRLSIPKTTISGWKGRDSVPYELCVQIADMTGTSLDWLLLGMRPQTGDAESGLERVEDGGQKWYAIDVPIREDEDPRLAAILSWLRTWWSTAEADERTWLLVELRRTFPEIGEWIKARAPP